MQLPDRRVLIRWMFNALGLLLIFGHRFVIDSILRAEYWAGLIFGEGTAASYYFMAAAYFYLIPTALLCWITAALLKRKPDWAVPPGVLTCALLLLGFPFFTLAGVFGLYVLFTTSPVPAPLPTSFKRSRDYWHSKRQSKLQPAVHTLLWFGAFALQARFAQYAQREGMPPWHSGWTWWLWFSGFVFLNTALHESGHAIVAWAVGFPVRIFSMGPFTFWRDRSGLRFRLDWGKLFDGGGYTGAASVCDQYQRRNEIAIIAAGPVTNALLCLIALDVFFALPGTAWQAYWWIPAMTALVAGVTTVANLIPIGYCDGSMLFHLILNTRAGRLLLDGRRVAGMEEEANACRDRADFEKEIELKQSMLDRARKFGLDNSYLIAGCSQILGSAYSQIDEWPSAEHYYRKCLGFEAELAANPGLAGNVWSGIQLSAARRHDSAAAAEAYANALAILNRQKTAAGDPNGSEMTYAMLAQAHERAGQYLAALDEVDRGLKAIPDTPGAILLRAYFLRMRAICSFNIADVEAGMTAVQAAANLLRSPHVPAASRNLAWENLADLGAELWRSSHSLPAIDLLREGLAGLEAGGAAFCVARFRIKLADILRQSDRLDEAGRALPEESAVAPLLRRAFLKVRAELHLALGRADAAVSDARELVDLWRSHPHECAPEIAASEGLLAKALLATGDYTTAESFASNAAEFLGPSRRPDAASCAVTIALARCAAAGNRQAGPIAAALALIESAPLLGHAEKARARQAETARIERFLSDVERASRLAMPAFVPA